MKGTNPSDQVFVQKLTEIIHANLENENFGVDELARASGMPRSYIYRRLMAISEKSTTQFIREVRLQRAMEMLQQEDTTAAEVAYRVGFSSPAYFSTCFHEYFGFPPGEVKNRNINELEGNNSIIASDGIDEVEKPLQKIQSEKYSFIPPVAFWHYFSFTFFQ